MRTHRHPDAPPAGTLISQVTIRGFKSIVEATLDLGRLNVFVGANGVGKSAILEALGVLGVAAEGRVDDTALLRHGVRPGVPGLYKNAFENRPVPRVISLGATSTGKPSASYDLCLSNPIRAAATPWKLTQENLTVGSRKIATRSPRGATLWDQKGRGHPFKPKDPTRTITDTPNPWSPPPPEAVRLLDALRGYAIFDPQTHVLRGIGQETGPLDPLGLHGGRLAEAVEFLIFRHGLRGEFRSAWHEIVGLIDWASGVGVARPTPDLISPSLPVAKLVTRFRDRFMKEGRNHLSAYDASEGALYVLFAFTLLHHPRAPRVFAVENVDHALNPRLARRLIEVMSRHVKVSDRQVLLTTHNPLVLDGLDLSDPDVRLFTVDRNVKGHTKVRRLAFDKALSAARAKNLPLSQLWTRGLIGGVPAL